MASSLSNRNSANVLHNSVLPTPVGPSIKKELLGRFCSDKPARDRRIALATALTALSCPTTRSLNCCSISNSFSCSPLNILLTGMPVQRDTTSAISSLSTLLRMRVVDCSSEAGASAICFSNSGIMPYCNSDILPRSPSR